MNDPQKTPPEETPPEPFHPQSAKDVEERFGPNAADVWFAAKRDRRHAIELYLRTHGQHLQGDKEWKEEAKKEIKEMTQAAESFKKELLEVAAEQKERAKILPMTFYAAPGKEHALRDEQINHLMVIALVQESLQQKPSDRADEELAFRTVRLHMIEALLQGALSYENIRNGLVCDMRAMMYDDFDREHEYSSYIEHLTKLGLISANSPDTQS